MTINKSRKINPNRKRIVIDLEGNWHIYQSYVEEGYEILGTVMRSNEEPGALAKNKKTGEYFQLNEGKKTYLLQRKVISALKSQGFFE